MSLPSYEREKVMGQRGPLVTAVVVVGGLVGLMTANAAGGLVTAAPTPSNAAQEQAVQEETSTPEEPPASTAPPTSEAPPPPATEEPPPAPTFPAEVVYAGEDAGGAMAIAIAVKGDEASAYLCDGAAVESWLRGTATDGKIELASKDGATTLSAGLSGADVTGTLSVGGQPEIDFTIPVAQPPAGLYRGEDGETTVGWIILSDGTQVGIASSASGDRPAPPLDPARGSVTIGGSTVTAEKVAGDTTFG
jgi:hypothetical protein